MVIVPIVEASDLRAILPIKKSPVSIANDASLREADNFADIKRNFRDEVENLIASLSIGDAILTEASRAIFKSILGYYSRDTYTAKAYKGY